MSHVYRWWIAVADSRDHPAGMGLLERRFFASLDATKASGERGVILSPHVRVTASCGSSVLRLREGVISTNLQEESRCRWWWPAGHEIPRLWARNDTLSMSQQSGGHINRTLLSSVLVAATGNSSRR